MVRADEHDGSDNGAAPDRGAAIRDGVFAAIVEHRLPPGTKLSEIKVGAAYGVSRTVARAVLQTLSHEGLVTIERNRGAFVARPDAEEARQVFAARRLVEPSLAREAAARATAPDLAALEAHLAEEAAALRAGDRRSEIRLSGQFHELLAELAANAVLARFLRELTARTSLIIALYGRSDASTCGVHDHGEILDALAHRDADAAADAMLRHLDHIEGDLDLGRQAADGVDLVAVLRAGAGAG